jgi:putative tricarboxylic transport membrane protein
MMLGFALAAVGIDTVTGQLRLTFGFTELLKGFDFLIAVIGLFGIGEILLTIEEGSSSRAPRRSSTCASCSRRGRSCRRYWKTSIAAPWSVA